MEKQGVFYAVSVGPGDPELLTRQACRVLTDCGVVAAPRMKSGRMLALDIAAGAVDMQGKTILPLDFTMARDAAVREDSYRTAAAAIETALAAGQDVAMVNLGDVSVYATAYYILERIRADGFETVMCPGVTSFCAVAARLGRSLTRMDEPLHILPGTLESWPIMVFNIVDFPEPLGPMSVTILPRCTWRATSSISGLPW